VGRFIPSALEAIAPGRHPPHVQGMTKPATKRPGTFQRPDHWTNEPPPAPGEAQGGAEELSPTRYGDWVKKGIAIDF